MLLAALFAFLNLAICAHASQNLNQVAAQCAAVLLVANKNTTTLLLLAAAVVLVLYIMRRRRRIRNEQHQTRV